MKKYAHILESRRKVLSIKVLFLLEIKYIHKKPLLNKLNTPAY